jgi:uncharacterized protein (DUF1015 family)
VPEIRPFRALRYDRDAVPDLAAVVAPPYDVVDPALRAQLMARHPKNVVRLDLPADEAGDEPDERYRRTARTLATWRSDGTLHKDPRSALYVYEQTYRVPGTETSRTQRGFFGRLRLEAYGKDGTILPHERTLEGPREDRYRLLRATGVNTSPVIGLYADPSGTASAILAKVAASPAAVDLHDDDGVRHRLWVVESDGETAPEVRSLIAAAAAEPITIADGHHRYETALRYRDERRMSRSCEEDPAFDYLLMLFLETTAEPLTVLATHRLIRGSGPEVAGDLENRLGEWFDLRPAGRAELEREFGTALAAGGRGRFGLWTRAGGHILTARHERFAGEDGAGEALHGIDAWVLAVVLERVLGIDTAILAAGERVGYTKSVRDALARVDDLDGPDAWDAAFLLEPTPVASITAVARSGEVMPQKSTYFYPKALTGLVINPHEW